MVFLHYPEIAAYENIWVAVLEGTPERGGSGIALRGYYKSEFVFGSAADVTWPRTVYTTDDVPEELLALWTKYVLTEGL